MDWLLRMRELFSQSVEQKLCPDCAVIYSGGVDSALVAYVASGFQDTIAYNVGIEGSMDAEYAKKYDGSAPFETRYVTLSLGEIEELIPPVVKAAKSSNPVDIGVGIPFYAASKLAAEEGKKALLCGQGGDELFGGYWRYLECISVQGPEKTSQMMERDWNNAYEDNLDRDILMCQSNGIELEFPFLAEPFSEYARSLPLNLKIREDADIPCDLANGRRFARKYCLKKMALDFGLPQYLVNRKKKAAQYGSGIQKSLDRIARMRGYRQKARQNKRTDYLRSYLEDILSDS